MPLHRSTLEAHVVVGNGEDGCQERIQDGPIERLIHDCSLCLHGSLRLSLSARAGVAAREAMEEGSSLRVERTPSDSCQEEMGHDHRQMAMPLWMLMSV